MRHALEVAERGRGQVRPNPLVGCVLVKDGKIIAEGWHDHLGGLHAEQMAIHDAEEKGFTDSLMLDHEGNIAEATGANIFFKDNTGALHTPIPDSFLDGITRREVIKIAKSKGIKVTERKIKLGEIKDFVGCFLTGTAAEVTPVSKISEYNFRVCDLITDLNKSYQSLVRKKTAA